MDLIYIANNGVAGYIKRCEIMKHGIFLIGQFLRSGTRVSISTLVEQLSSVWNAFPSPI